MHSQRAKDISKQQTEGKQENKDSNQYLSYRHLSK